MANVTYFNEIGCKILRKIEAGKKITESDLPYINNMRHCVPDMPEAKPEVYNFQKGFEFCAMKQPEIKQLFTKPVEVSCVKVPARCKEGMIDPSQFESYLGKATKETSINGYLLAWSSEYDGTGMLEQWESVKRGDMLRCTRHIPAPPEGREAYERWALSHIVKPKMAIIAAPPGWRHSKSKEMRQYRMDQLWTYAAWISEPVKKA